MEKKKNEETAEAANVQLDENDDLLPHYDLDYSKSKPNRFAVAYRKDLTINAVKDDSESR